MENVYEPQKNPEQCADRPTWNPCGVIPYKIPQKNAEQCADTPTACTPGGQSGEPAFQREGAGRETDTRAAAWRTVRRACVSEGPVRGIERRKRFPARHPAFHMKRCRDSIPLVVQKGLSDDGPLPGTQHGPAIRLGEYLVTTKS